ncbi:unnamed protein product [Ostreobium quekettii]|uniref:Uncharacterized protein n=1 Tax=Ostreobium quekettii TaxID=121088 RepID=A0A8S1IXJ5_9CHLO|nr:unnamed protein product [Ostreobium quekettii]
MAPWALIEDEIQDETFVRQGEEWDWGWQQLFAKQTIMWVAWFPRPLSRCAFKHKGCRVCANLRGYLYVHCWHRLTIMTRFCVGAESMITIGMFLVYTACRIHIL